MSDKAYIRMIETAESIQKGDWLFTCDMEPKQFESFDPEKSPDDWERDKFSDKNWEQFSKYGDFTTIGGACHSQSNCGLHPVSEKYAKWFIENKCWEEYDKLKGSDINYDSTDNDIWEDYEIRVKERCEEEGITYEGI